MKITYEDKVSLVTSPLPRKNKVTSTDMNEIKEVVNANSLETGTNENGTYVKFDNGVLICTKLVQLTGVAITTAIGSMYRTGELSLGDFAETFISVPNISIDIAKLSGDVYIGMIGSHFNISETSAGAIQILRPTSSASADFDIEIIAIGRWK